MVIKMPHTALNGASVALVGNPLRFSETAVSYRQPPPLLGEHTDEVLSEVLGTDEAERKTLQEAGVI
jgi:crotonobetainyl-CoA:carnitine CoA-transferase CaiB-like acyl-CoA transferase